MSNPIFHDEHIELDVPHHVVVSMPDDSHKLVGQVITEKKRDATPHNRYLGPDNLGVIEAVCPQAMVFIVRVPHNERLTLIRFWDAQFKGELSKCSHLTICDDDRSFAKLDHNNLPTMNSYFNDDNYNWLNLGWARGSPYSMIFNSDDYAE